ncbi:MAG TPA: alpha/beta hydrolase [Caulobacteraceae bacterium]|nr:alpha/beta hydrolase [Caulobacteraceae bacterium]
MAVVLALVVAAVIFVLVNLGGHDNRDAFADSRPPPDFAERFYPPENWAWGEIQPDGGQVQRYGVSGAAVVSRADILILPDYGESAETWFETARDLNAAGYTVWVLEGVGQGGSARITGHRDLGELRSFDHDLAAIRAMTQGVIKPAPGRAFVILGEGVGALLAARDAETDAAASGVILSAPHCAPAIPGGTLTYLGLGTFRAPGGDAWSRAGPDDFAAHRTHDRWRGAVTHAWQLTNPDLRLGGPSLDWQAALADLQRDAEASAARLKIAALVIDDGKPRACLAPPVALRRSLIGADQALELEDDRWRAPWLAEVAAFIANIAKPPRHP